MLKNKLKPAISILALCSLLSIFSCKPSTPSEFLQPDELEELLYDYHKADGIAEVEGRTTEEKNALTISYREAVLRKHGVTQQEFDKSMAYYYRHTAEIKAIYDNLSVRFEKELSEKGAAISKQNKQFSENGDTINIWKQATSYTLTPIAPHNKITFAIKPDAKFKKGDNIVLSFKTAFISQDGNRDATAVLSIKFNNDSIKTLEKTIYSDTEYNLQIQDLSRVGIKEIRGFIYNHKGGTENTQSLKLLNIYDIYILRIHTSEEQQNKSKKDTINIMEFNPRLNPERQRNFNN